MLKFLAKLLLLSTLTQAGNINTIEDGVAVIRNSAYCQSFSIKNAPKPHSLLSGETRRWYNDRLGEILEILNSGEYKNYAKERKL